MASPFSVFRSNLKPLMVALTLLALFAFVALPAIQMYQQSAIPGGSDEVVATYTGGSFNSEEIGYYQRQHGQTNRFLADVAELVVDRGGTPRVPNYGADGQGRMTYGISSVSSPQTVVYTKIYADRAMKMGLELDDSAIQVWLDQFVDGKLSANDLAALRSQASGGTLGQSQLFQVLRTELTANLYERMLAGGLSTGRSLLVSPVVAFQNFLKLNQQAKAVAYPVLVEEYLDEVSDPKEATLLAIYEEGKEKFPNPNSSEPGFRRPYAADVEYVAAHLEDFIAREIETLSEETLRAEYDRRLAGGDFVMPNLDISTEMEAVLNQGGDLATPETESPAIEGPIIEPPASDVPAENSPGTSEEVPTGDGNGDSPLSGLLPDETGVRLVASKMRQDEQPPAEQPPAEQPPAEQPPAEQPPAEQPPAEQPPAEQPPAEQPPAEQPPAEQPPAEQPPAEQPPAEQPPAEQPPAEQPPAEQPPAEQPPAEQPPAEQPPAEQPPAEQPPAEQPPAEQPPAEQPPAEQPPAEQPPAEQPPAEMSTETTDGADTAATETAEEAATESTPEPPAPKTFEEVRDEIARDLATPKAREAFDIAIDKSYSIMKDYLTELTISKGDAGAEVPAVPNLEELATELGLRYEKTGFKTILDVYQDPLGQARTGAQGNGDQLGESMFNPQRPVYYPFRALFRGQAEGQIAYSAWKTEARESYIPKFDEVREEVIAAAKLAEARQLAQEAAEKIAAAANASPEKPLKELDEIPETRRTLVFEDLGPFSWMISIGYGYRPFMAPVTELDRVGQEFMKTVFMGPIGEYEVAANEPKSVYYVVKATEVTPTAEELRARYMEPNQRASAASLGVDDLGAIRQGENKRFEESSGLEWNQDALGQR